MYDSTQEAREFVGRDRAEAVAKAAGYFGLPQEELAIAEPEVGSIAGLGARGPRRDDDRGGRGGRGGRDRSDREGGRGRREAREEQPREFRESPAERPARAVEASSSEPSVGTATGELGELGSFVKGLVERMDLGPFEITETSENEALVVVQVRGAAAQRLVGGEGRTVDAMQLLANQVSIRISGDDAPRVVLDVEGDAEQREVYLTRVAERAASRARETGRPVALEAMNPKDRRTVHVALREADGIATMSVGDGRYRQVVVVPDNAPEYEEAKRYESQSQRESRD
jgi:predicted RNA-binding protein Jag